MNISPEQEVSSTESTESVASESNPAQEASTAAQEMLELDKIEKFKFQGKEWTPKDFTSAYMRHADYTRKVQEISEERKFTEALKYDLPKLKDAKNFAEISEEFKRVYPEKFHWVLDQFKPSPESTQTGPQAQVTPSTLPPEWQAKLGKLDTVLADYEERQIKAAESELDSVFTKYSAKYPYADESKVTMYAQAALDKGQKLNDQTWETIFKTVHEQDTARLKRWQTEQLNQQKTANLKGQDTAAGGGIPGQAPRTHRNLKEAQAALIKSMENGMTLDN